MGGLEAGIIFDFFFLSNFSGSACWEQAGIIAATISPVIQ